MGVSGPKLLHHRPRSPSPLSPIPYPLATTHLIMCAVETELTNMPKKKTPPAT